MHGFYSVLKIVGLRPAENKGSVNRREYLSIKYFKCRFSVFQDRSRDYKGDICDSNTWDL